MRIFGAILMAIGILIAGVSGLCSLFIIGAGIFDGSGQVGDALGMVAIFGLVPFAIGALMIFVGYKITKSDDRSMPPPPVQRPDAAARPARPLDADEQP